MKKFLRVIFSKLKYKIKFYVEDRKKIKIVIKVEYIIGVVSILWK